MEGIVFVSRLILGSVFIMASLTKLPRITSFSGEIQQYQILSPFAAKVSARVLPLFELALGLAFLAGLSLPIASPAAAILLTIFILAAASAIRRKLYIGCACFGLLFRMPISSRTLARDGVLLAMSVLVWVEGTSVPSIIEASSEYSNLWHASVLTFTGAAATACLWLVYLANRGRMFPSDILPLDDSTTT